MKEKVIFRREYDPYMEMEKYLAIFPDDPASPGRVVCVPIYQTAYQWYKDCVDEADLSYIYKCKIVHKREDITSYLVDALKEFYGGEYEVCEKIMRK